MPPEPAGASEPARAILFEKLLDSIAEGPPKLTPRDVIGATALAGKATAVIGMRRAGKTFFMHQQRAERLARGVPLERLPYVNFEDERFDVLSARDLTALVEDYYARFPGFRGRQTVTWCFDEIQTVPGWDRFVRRLLDTERVEIFVSGSSARLLSREVATALRGRAWEVVIHPFSFAEVSRHRGLGLKGSASNARDRSQVENAVASYLSVGGFPEVQQVDSQTRRRMLGDYVDVAMLRDIVERHSISGVTALRWLVRHLLGNPAALFSVEKFHRALKSQGLAVAKDTVHALVAHLEDCFLVRTSWLEADSERQRMSNPRKAYPVDPGLIPVFDRSGRANLGHALETAVRIELERRGCAITYARTTGGREIDFHARFPDGAVQLIQVCADAGDEAVAGRELTPLVESQFRVDRRILIALTRDRLPEDRPQGVECLAAGDWLLNPRA